VVLLKVLLLIELGVVRECSEFFRIIALEVFTVAVKVDQERDLLSACLETNEGAGVLADLATTVFEGADDEKLLRDITINHRGHHIQLEL
jgi:hypothetical protein